MSQHIETRSVHAGREPDERTGAVVMPLYLASTYARDAEGGFSTGYKYSRYDNPNRRALEHCLADLEGGIGACAFGSGMAAVHAVFQLFRAGDHVVVTKDAYVGVLRLVADVLRPNGIEVSLVDFACDDALDAIREGTKLVWTETPSNPLLKVMDLTAVVVRAQAVGALTACDNTFATPVLQQPFRHGIDLVMHSSTKYLGGHSDVLGGILVVRDSSELLERLRAIQMIGGAVPAPFDCYMVMRGISTLALRVRAQSDNALRLAEWLAEHPRVRSVHYPFLAEGKQGEIARKQMSAGGGMVSFQLASASEALATANATHLFLHATSLGSVESLIEHRYSGEPPDTPTPPGLLRLSVGIEHFDDLRDDLAQALEQSHT